MFSFLKRVNKRPRCAALVAAAGSSSRMGGVNKLMEELDGMPVLARTLTALERAELVDEIIIATREEEIVTISELCRTYGITKCTKVVRGGESRVHSVMRAAMEASPKTGFLAVQDGARPLITDTVIDRTVRAAHTYGAAAPAIPVKDTIKVVTGGVVKETPDRATLQAVQTPQVFDFDLLRGALKKAAQDGAAVTDDCSAVELMGMSVKIVEGDERNIKVTTPMDLKIAKLLLEEMK